MKVQAICLAAGAALAMPAGALEKWGPTWSELSGNLQSRTQMNRQAAVISRVDGKSYTDRIVKVEPGKHAVVVRSPMRKGFAGTDVTMDMTLDPCQRYYINAQFESGAGRDWEPVVVVVEAIPGCKHTSQ